MPCGNGMEKSCGITDFSSLKKGGGTKKEASKLKKGLLNGRVYWTGNWLEDFGIYLQNHHVVVSLFCCHQLDPFSRGERCVVFICGLMWSTLAAAGSLHATQDKAGDEARALRVVLSIVFGLLIFIFTTMMKSFAKCGAGSCAGVDKCCGAVGHAGMCCGASFALGMLGLGIFLLSSSANYQDDSTLFWISFALNQGISWGYGLVIGMAMFSWAWRSGHNKAKEAAKKKKDAPCVLM